MSFTSKFKQYRFEIIAGFCVVAVISITAVAKANYTQDTPIASVAATEVAEEVTPVEVTPEPVEQEAPAPVNEQATPDSSTATNNKKPTTSAPKQESSTPQLPKFSKGPLYIKSIRLEGAISYCTGTNTGNLYIYDAFAGFDASIGNNMSWTIEIEEPNQPTIYSSYSAQVAPDTISKSLKVTSMTGPQQLLSTYGPSGKRARIHITAPNSVYSEWTTINCP